MNRLLNYKAARKLALESCKEYGIPATFVRKSYLRNIEGKLRNFIIQSAPAAVADGRKSIK